MLLPGIYVVSDGDEADAEKGEDLFQIFPGFDVIPTEAAQIFYYDTVHLPVLNVAQHTVKFRAVKADTGIAVVNIFFI